MPKHFFRQVVLHCALLVTGAAVATTAPVEPAVSFSSLNDSFLDGYTRMIGWQFTVSKPVQVAALGWFDWQQDGLARSHEVGLWNAAGQVLLASATVEAGTSAALTGYFRYTPLASAITSTPGVTYRVAGLDIGAQGDPHVWTPQLSGFNAHVNGSSYAAAFQLAPGFALGGIANEFGYPEITTGGVRQALLGPNLLVSAVPEPGMLGLLAAGLGVVVLRARRPTR